MYIHSLKTSVYTKINREGQGKESILWRTRHVTCDADLGRPFGRAVEDALFDLLHVGYMGGFWHAKHVLDQLENLWLVPLSDLHAVLQDHDDVLGPILGSVLGAFLCSSCTFVCV